MPWSRILGRFAVALVSFVVVSGALLLAFGSVALSIDWEIPEARQLRGPSSVFDRNGMPLARFAAEVERTEVPLGAISPNLRDAVVAAEDHRFYEHRGVDPLSVIRAVWRNVTTGAIAEGGSTLTQQYVKQVYVGDEITFSRKIREAVVSLQLEKELTKDEILEDYLNRAYFGDGAYGAEAAAQTYFDVPASDLTLGQAATLAAIIRRPSEFSPRHDLIGAVARRNEVLDEMAQYGFRAAGAIQAAKAEPLTLAEPEPFLPAAPFIIEEIRQQMLDVYGPDLLYNGGLAITASIELERQFELERAMVPHLPSTPGFEPAAAVVDPRTGDVMAAWSGRDFAQSQVDLALGRDFGRPSGSTFKVFALATALEEGHRLDEVWRAPSQITIGDWSPRGGGCGGACTLESATVFSINTVYAQVAEAVGAADFTQMARRLGVTSSLPDNDLTQVLGTGSVTPLDMASAFATLSNDGVACPARVIIGITDPDGVPLPPPDPRAPSPEEVAAWQARMSEQGFHIDEADYGRCYRALPRSVARNVNATLQQVVARGTGKRAQIGRPQAGKTGTTSSSTQVWFTGYTPDLSMSVMVSHRDGDVPLRNLPGCGAECYGGQLPAMIWADLATTLLEDVPPTEFPEPGIDDRATGDRRTLIPRALRRPGDPTPTPIPVPTFTPTPTPTSERTFEPILPTLPPDRAGPEMPEPPPEVPGLIDRLFPG